jgi:nucleoside-triphosphatase THEP1
LQRGGDAENPNVTGSDTLADEVQVNLHVLRALMLHGIGGEVDRADVVAVDESGALKGTVELVEELS